MKTLLVGPLEMSGVQSRLIRLSRVVPLALMLVAPLAEAQSMPKEFDFSVTYTFATRRTAVDLGAPNVAVAIEGSFVATNDAGGPFMNQMFGQCSYAFIQASDSPEMLGGCSYEDRDGDKLFESFHMLGGRPGETKFFGGTGKFAGIRCEGKFVPVAASKDRSKGIGRKTGSCRFS